jgi:plasmid stabilization system protein ParE
MAHRVAPRAEADLDDIWLYVAKESASMEAALPKGGTGKAQKTVLRARYLWACVKPYGPPESTMV